VSDNLLSDIAVVTNFKKLTYLDAGGNKLKNIAVLRELQYLTYLDLNSNLIEDLTPIIECQGMRTNSYFNIRGNQLSGTARNEQVPILQGRGVWVVL
jgi:Leucine-rich repeat (LRR) protein